LSNVEKYLRPDVIRQVERLDLRARFIIEGFLSGLHASPFQGFSVEFSEHRKYNPGDDIKDIDWNVYAKTEKHYVKKFQAETNMSGWMVLDSSGSMGWTFRQQLTKFDYAVSLSAALAYLMIRQQDPVGLAIFNDKIHQSLPPKSKRSHLGAMISLLGGLKPQGVSDPGAALKQLQPLMRHKSLVMLFSDMLTETEPVIDGLRRLRFAGHEVIVFHVLDEAEIRFPFDQLTEFHDIETPDKMTLDARAVRADYIEAMEAFRKELADQLGRSNIDYVPLDTSVNFDKALIGYLQQRQRRF
jgi:uncharacterized protein (DUF58 family)